MINITALEQFEKITETQTFGQRPAVYLKDTIADILRYADCIYQMYLFPTGDPDRLEELGQRRSSAHNKVITDLNMLRRMFQQLGLGDLFEGAELNDRNDYKIAAFELLGVLMSQN